MNYDRWAPRYAAIRAEFGFDMAREETAREALLSLLPAGARTDPLGRISRRLSGREVVVVGRAPGAGPPPIWSSPARPAVVACDGATSICLEAGLVPELIVTDLDGPVPSEIASNARGSLAVVHAHGDNLGAVERWVPEFVGELVGSWAGPPEEELIDPGGFTDGDRAVYLAESVGASRIRLWGFDFARVDLDDPARRARKLAKLRWADALIAELAASSPVPIVEWRRDGSERRYGPGPTGPATQ